MQVTPKNEDFQCITQGLCINQISKRREKMMIIFIYLFEWLLNWNLSSLNLQMNRVPIIKFKHLMWLVRRVQFCSRLIKNVIHMHAEKKRWGKLSSLITVGQQKEILHMSSLDCCISLDEQKIKVFLQKILKEVTKIKSDTIHLRNNV